MHIENTIYFFSFIEILEIIVQDDLRHIHFKYVPENERTKDINVEVQWKFVTLPI